MSTRTSNWLRYELYGAFFITLIIAIAIGTLEIYQKVAPSSVSTTNILNLGNGGWTGVFVTWLVLILIFSLVNAIFHSTKR